LSLLLAIVFAVVLAFPVTSRATIRTAAAVGPNSGAGAGPSAYALVPDESSKSYRQGSPFMEAASSWRIAPYLESVEPIGDGVPVSASLSMRFSQPMSHPSVERSFAIRPRVDGRLTWVDDSTLRFEPVRLAHGVTYQVQFAGRSLDGSQLAGPRNWRFTTAGGAPPVLAPTSLVRVPILMYHYIRVNPDPRDRLGFGLSVTPADFAAQMDWLSANGFHTITFRDLHAYLAGATGLPSRPVILTFDDGYADFYTTALPILVKHDFRAVAYVVSGFVGKGGYMTAQQVQEADRADIEIGSHTVDHADLTRQTWDGLRYQVTASKQSLELLLGHPVISFCYPSGGFSPAAVAAVQQAGYWNATTTRFGYWRTMDSRFLWGRLRISGGEQLALFAMDVLRAS
jgi:peptidoglycan/xylan/chitin deacetylase (PgdA/CDA1 family)